MGTHILPRKPDEMLECGQGEGEGGGVVILLVASCLGN